MATAAMRDPLAGFERLAHDYIRQTYAVEPGRRMPTAAQVSREFSRNLDAFFAGEIEHILAHPQYRLHIVTSRGRHILGREGRLRTPLGYAGALISNAISRRTLGAWLERVVFSAPGEPLPLDLRDLRHHRIALTEGNFHPVLLASCSIPFVLQAVHDIPGAPSGAYWDGGITDYHLHLDYRTLLAQGPGGLVLYPHFQRRIVPGWLDKHLRHRHGPTPALDNVLVLAPDPDWVATLPNAKLPDRRDFKRYADDLPGRISAWNRAVAESERLVDEFRSALETGRFDLQPL
jgi:hypothetical protein